MTIKELINRLEVLYDATYEDAPGEAANAVCEFLTSNGHQDIVENWHIFMARYIFYKCISFNLWNNCN